MLDTKFFKDLSANLRQYHDKRREIIKAAGDAQSNAKRAIFALQRDDQDTAQSLLNDAKAILAGLRKKHAKEPRLFHEGAFKAALEELIEAELFAAARAGKTVGDIKNLVFDNDDYVSGLCDVPGELVRYAIKSATERKFDMVKKVHTVAEEIIGTLVEMDLTGYHRQKFDQAKQALHKLEQIVYEVTLRT